MINKTLIILFTLMITISFSQNRRFERYLTDIQNEFQVPQISADSLENIKPLILDIREKEEYDISHLKNAKYAGYYNFSLDQLNSIDKDTTIVVYCSVGYRSSKIAKKLLQVGFKDVRNLYGGIFKWVNQNREILKNSTSTDSLHTYNKRWARYITNKSIIKIQ